MPLNRTPVQKHSENVSESTEREGQPTDQYVRIKNVRKKTSNGKPTYLSSFSEDLRNTESTIVDPAIATNNNGNGRDDSKPSTKPFGCLNCSQLGHTQRQCPKPRDKERIRRNYLEYKSVKRQSKPKVKKGQQNEEPVYTSDESPPLICFGFRTRQLNAEEDKDESSFDKEFEFELEIEDTITSDGWLEGLMVRSGKLKQLLDGISKSDLADENPIRTDDEFSDKYKVEEVVETDDNVFESDVNHELSAEAMATPSEPQTIIPNNASTDVTTNENKKQLITEPKK